MPGEIGFFRIRTKAEEKKWGREDLPPSLTSFAPVGSRASRGFLPLLFVAARLTKSALPSNPVVQRKRMVGTRGFEPPWLAPQRPQRCAYTSSATSPKAYEYSVNRQQDKVKHQILASTRQRPRGPLHPTRNLRRIDRQTHKTRHSPLRRRRHQLRVLGHHTDGVTRLGCVPLRAAAL